MPARSMDPSFTLPLAADEVPGPAWSLPPWALLLLVTGGIALLLLLVIKAKLHAFVALLVVSVVVAAIAGISPTEIPGLLEDGMGDTLGEIAIIVALGAMLGRMIQESGASDVLSGRLLAAFGERRAPLAVGLTALIFGIPVFFDVGFIILLPLIYSVAQRSGRSVISVALPAVGGLAIMHAVLPPHPGPVAAAGLLGANLGWVTIMGLVCGLPAWFVGAYLFGTRIGDRLGTPVPTALLGEAREQAGTRGASGGGVTTPAPPSLRMTVGVILLPVLLIMLNTFAGIVLPEGAVREVLEFIGAPVIALTAATLLSFWVLGLRGGFSGERVENRLPRLCIAAAAVEPEREAVSLVTDPLQELEARRVTAERHGLGAARDEDLLLALGEADHGYATIDEGLQRPHPRRQLALAAVDHDQRRQRREAGVALAVVR